MTIISEEYEVEVTIVQDGNPSVVIATNNFYFPTLLSAKEFLKSFTPRVCDIASDSYSEAYKIKVYKCISKLLSTGQVGTDSEQIM